MKKIITILTISVILLVSFLRIAPIIYKGYPPSAIYENLILARNLALYNVYQIESEKNVILSSSRVEKEGIESALGNKLTPVLYAQLYKIFGLNEKIPIYTSILFFALSNVILFFIVLKLFGYWPAVIFSIFDLFMPVAWKGAVMPGFYEFAIFFFSLGLLIYFLNKNYLSLFFCGIIFALAVLSRNAFIFSALPLFAYDFFKTKSFKRLIIFVLPFLIIVGGFFAADFFKGEVNSYLSKKPDSFLAYGHLFPDPYTYHFDRENYLSGIRDVNDPDISEFLLKYGYGTNFKNRVLMYLNSLIFYPKKLFSVTVFGGPILVLLMIVGAIYLYRNNKDLFKYFLFFWLPFWYLTLVWMKTNNWDHFLEVSFPLILMMSLGAYWLIEKFQMKRLAVGLLVLMIFLQIFSAARWMFHEMYESSSLTQYPGLIESVKKTALTDADVVAVGIHPGIPELLNYYTDRNFIYFNPDTIEKLIKENKLKEAFGKFNVNYFLTIKNNIDVSLEKL